MKAKEFLKTKGLKDTLFNVENNGGWVEGGLSNLLDEYLIKNGYNLEDIEQVATKSYNNISQLINQVNDRRGEKCEFGFNLDNVTLDKDKNLLIRPVQPQPSPIDNIASGIGGVNITDYDKIIEFLENYLRQE